MLDFDLAELYGVETRVLVQAVKRNIKRFPARYMFQLTEDELTNWKSQIVTSKMKAGNSSQIVMGSQKHRGSKYLPYAFTEHGITMLSAVLRSDTAINVSIAIVDAFILLKQYHNNFELLQKRVAELEAHFNRKIENINEVIEFLLKQPELLMPEKKAIKKTNPIGFKTDK